MSSFPNITSSSLMFFLMGIPGLEASHAWISIPFCCLYITAPSGGGIILFVIIIESNLHKSPLFPLYALHTDLGLCISTLVTMLGIFWFTARQIIFHACVAQTFFIQLFTVMESSVLLVMAFDHFIAICNPLRYATILTDSRILNMWFAILVRGTVILMPLVLLLRHLCSCQSHVLHHSYCFHPDIIQLSRSDNKINSVLGLTALIVTAEVASIFIPLSNTLIIKTILSIASPQEQHKAFSICVSHIGAVVIFYIPLISLCFVYRFGQKVPPYVHSLMANVYLLILPVMNPIIYHGKTKQIHRSIKKVLFPKG
ncbi:LOW QUALITY PROTEIN: olfactory receptor 51F2-like [Diceros bicornis minor]|uniref:LOW QUALITY PROTEIN: olfactory receptor 51F2-like n=1 Tax=Diceros bicornis minor TaxID=77932 RepID=UPI0026EF0B0E|nr:LOW QUALITY PROTEIN: olfactory receptor 51F2-like [Diceros bicornis minor]